MHYIVLAGGESSRLRPLTRHTSKTLLQLADGSTLLDRHAHIAESLTDVSSCCVFIQPRFRDRFYEWGARQTWNAIDLIDIPRTEKPSPIATLAEHVDVLERDDFYIANGDSFLEPLQQPYLHNMPEDSITLLVSLDTHGLLPDSKKVVLNDDGTVHELGKDIPHHRAHGESAGIICVKGAACREEFVQAIRDIYSDPHLDNHYWHTIVKRLIHKGITILTKSLDHASWFNWIQQKTLNALMTTFHQQLPKRPVMRDIQIFVADIVHLSIHWLSVRVRKNPRVWIYGAWFGNTYSDNSKYLFEYVSKHKPHITSVWLSRSAQVVALVRSKGFRAHHFYSLQGIWYAMRAGVAIVCVGFESDVYRAALYGKTLFVQLWHGVGPKKIGTDNVKKTPREMVFPSVRNRLLDSLLCLYARMLFRTRYSSSRLLPYKNEDYDSFDIVLTLSKMTALKTYSAFGKGNPVYKKRIVATGYPRYDSFFGNQKPASALEQRIIDLKKSGERIVLYAPTHRSEGHADLTRLHPPHTDDFYRQLKTNRIHMLVTMHYFHTRRTSQTDDQHNDRISDIAPHEYDNDIYPILRHVDCLITDYSSLYTDFLLLQRPIVFAPFDMREYIKDDREFFWPYDSVTPGPKAYTWGNTLKHTVALLDDEMLWRNERRAMLRAFHAHTYGSFSERVYNAIAKRMDQT